MEGVKVEGRGPDFALIGAAGYVAPKHFNGIAKVNGNLRAICDKSDSVGAIDKFFPDAAYFSEVERFERFILRQRHAGPRSISYLTVCTPNFLHDSHIRMGLRAGCDVICEKPIVVNPWNLEEIIRFEEETGCRTYTILQLRLHDEVLKLKDQIAKAIAPVKIRLKYVTVRGNWYQRSWKGVEEKSGGICANIGIHFFDLMCWIFNEQPESILDHYSSTSASGTLVFSKGCVEWFLSLDRADLSPDSANDGFERTLSVDDQIVDLSRNFQDLHEKSYQEILKGNGFRARESEAALNVLQSIRTQAGVLQGSVFDQR